MNLRLPWALLALGLLPGPAPAADSNRAALLDAIASEKLSLLVHLPRFDDPELQSAAALALSRGASVRLILSRSEISSRRAAAGLRAKGMQIRWLKNSPSRFIVTGSGRIALGLFDGSAPSAEISDTGPALISDDGLAREFRSRFENLWQGLKEGLPTATELKDELEALPDPRENEPRLRTRRRRN